jgi:hypothetical protein
MKTDYSPTWILYSCDKAKEIANTLNADNTGHYYAPLKMGSNSATVEVLDQDGYSLGYLQPS